MKSIRNVLAFSLLTGGAVLAAATGLSTATAQGTTAAAPATAAGHEGRGWGPYGKLNLTAEQQSSIKAIMTAAKPQMKSLHEQMKANHLKMMQTKPDDPNYASVTAEVAQTNATLASQRTTQHAELKAQMYAVLTPAQKTQLAALEAQWAANPHHGHWHHRGEPAPAGAAPAPST